MCLYSGISDRNDAIRSLLSHFFSVFHSSASKLSLDLLLSSRELPAPSVVTELLTSHRPFFFPSWVNLNCILIPHSYTPPPPFSQTSSSSLSRSSIPLPTEKALIGPRSHSFNPANFRAATPKILVLNLGGKKKQKKNYIWCRTSWLLKKQCHLSNTLVLWAAYYVMYITKNQSSKIKFSRVHTSYASELLIQRPMLTQEWTGPWEQPPFRSRREVTSLTSAPLVCPNAGSFSLASAS